MTIRQLFFAASDSAAAASFFTVSSVRAFLSISCADAVADLGGALDKLRRRSAQIEERFRQGVEAEGQKGKLLDRKFQEGLKKAKDSPDPPKRPFDYE